MKGGALTGHWGTWTEEGGGASVLGKRADGGPAYVDGGGNVQGPSRELPSIRSVRDVYWAPESGCG